MYAFASGAHVGEDERHDVFLADSSHLLWGEVSLSRLADGGTVGNQGIGGKHTLVGGYGLCRTHGHVRLVHTSGRP